MARREPTIAVALSDEQIALGSDDVANRAAGLHPGARRTGDPIDLVGRGAERTAQRGREGVRAGAAGEESGDAVFDHFRDAFGVRADRDEAAGHRFEERARVALE